MQFGTTKNKIICVNVLNSGCKSPNCLIITDLVTLSNFAYHWRYCNRSIM